MQITKKPQSSTEKNLRSVKPSRLVEEVPLLPKRFFTFPQETIAMVWLEDEPARPARGRRLRK